MDETYIETEGEKMMVDDQLQDMEDRTRRGESLSPDESLALVQAVRKLTHDLRSMDDLYNWACLQLQGYRERATKEDGRLRYVLQQLGKEAKFKRRSDSQDARFFRAYDTLCDVIEGLW